MVGEHQEESVGPSRSEEEGDGEVLDQVVGDIEHSITVRVFIPKASGHMLCKKREELIEMRQG